MDSWLVLRGIKTLALRMEQHQKNAMALAEWLKKQEKVKKVYYIGLKEREDRELIDRQCSGYGGMISFRVDSLETVKKVLKNVKLIRFAESLGGVESLLTFPMQQTHAEVPEELRNKLGVDETLMRLSVGIENADDLIADLAQAFAAED
jgi:cystathionine gamma-synthase